MVLCKRREGDEMKRILIILLTGFVFTSVYAQMDNPLKQGMPNTVTLSNGEVIYHLQGEWDSFAEGYGLWSGYGTYRNIIKITQTGSSLVGILMMDDKYYSKNWESIRAEFDKSGFKKVEMMTHLGTLESKGQINNDGNKIIIDDGEKRRMTLTRSCIMINHRPKIDLNSPMVYL